MDLGLHKRRAIICASSQGLGFGCAVSLAQEGADVFINGRDPTRLDRAAQWFRDHTLGVTPVLADLTTPEGRSALLAACPDPDILVTNSGGPSMGDFRNWSTDDWDNSLNQYMVSPIMLIKGVIDGMIERKFGRIVNLASRAVRAPPPFSGLSTSARAGLVVFASGLAREVARHNVTINNLLPGPFNGERQTESLRRVAELRKIDMAEALKERVAEVPAGRFGELHELGSYCAYLCSQQAGFVVGQSVLVDGGAVPTV